LNREHKALPLKKTSKIMMTMQYPSINAMMNEIHRWGETDQHPMKRMFLTRLGSAACSVFECAAVAKATLHLGATACRAATGLGVRIARFTFPHANWTSGTPTSSFNAGAINDAMNVLCRLIAGLASTVFVGVVFSPELNFKLHLRFGLAVDDLTAKKEREVAAKLAAEVSLAEVAQARKERFDAFETARNVKRQEEEDKNAIDSRLAELLNIR
jgi:hypothetical protein